MARVVSRWPSNRRQKGFSRYTRYLDGQIWRLTLRDVGSRTVKNARSIITRRGNAEGKMVHFTKLNATTFLVRAEPRRTE